MKAHFLPVETIERNGRIVLPLSKPMKTFNHGRCAVKNAPNLFWKLGQPSQNRDDFDQKQNNIETHVHHPKQKIEIR